MLEAISDLVVEYLTTQATHADTHYNEASLQHEIAWFLRSRIPSNWRIFFERYISSFGLTSRSFTKKEIDLVIVDLQGPQRIAIELKCPRNGQYPEQMFKACQDLEFLEQLIGAGFDGGLFIMHVADTLFHIRGSREGIYGHFRASVPICGPIRKPTGKCDEIANVLGSYVPVWTASADQHYFWVQPIRPAV